MSETVTRYVITHIPDSGPMSGIRALTFAAQGRNTYATMTEAAIALEEYRGPDGLPRVLSPTELLTLKVMPCECWAGHFDPVGVYF